MKKSLYIFLLLFLTSFIGVFSSCKHEEEKIADTGIVPTVTPLPSVEEISQAPITFVFLESEKDDYNSLYNQLAYLQMESKGYNIRNVYVNKEQDVFGVFSKLELDGTQYVAVTSSSLSEQVLSYQQHNDSKMVFIQYSEDYLDTILTYQIKLYEYYYLAGVALCSESSSKVAGFIADSPDEQTIRCINAFALGMKSVDDASVVIVNWSDGGADENIIAKLVENLQRQDCDVFSYFMSGNFVEKVAGRVGSHYMTMSTHTAINKDEKMAIKPNAALDIYYSNILNMDKNSLPYQFNYLGIRENILSYELSSYVSEDTKTAVETAYKNIQSGYEVFSGPIYNELGLVVPEGTTLPKEDILDMLWFVDNVVGNLPAG